MQTHTLNSRPSGRYSGNVAEAIHALRNCAPTTHVAVTEEGILAVCHMRGAEYGNPEFFDNWCEGMAVFPIVAGRVDLDAVAAFIGH